MIVYRNVVSHRVARGVALRQLAQRHVRRRDLCDAEPTLITAATFHGYPAHRPCPVCGGAELREVRWIYGDTLGRRSGTARSEEEIEQIVSELADLRIPAGHDGEVMVHLVEVCPECRWNHLLATAVAAVG